VLTLIPRSHETFKQEDSLFECLDEKKKTAKYKEIQNTKQNKTKTKKEEEMSPKRVKTLNNFKNEESQARQKAHGKVPHPEDFP
jgi:hypothetical protein